jgi:predicted hydrocarbon binding protein
MNIMGVKGTIAWNFMVDKVSKPLFQATYRELMNFLITTSGSVDEINKRLKEIGFKVGEHLLVDYSERIKQHAKEFHQFASTLQLAYKVNSGQEFTSIWISDDKRTVKFTDKKCPICEGVEISDMPGLQYCNLVSGVFKAVLDLRGFNGDSYQESCRAVGDEACTWTIKLLS